MQQLGPFAFPPVASSCTHASSEFRPLRPSEISDASKSQHDRVSDFTVQLSLYSLSCHGAPHWLYNGLGLEESNFQRYVPQSAAALQATASSIMSVWQPVGMACCTAGLCMHACFGKAHEAFRSQTCSTPEVSEANWPQTCASNILICLRTAAKVVRWCSHTARKARHAGRQGHAA